MVALVFNASLFGASEKIDYKSISDSLLLDAHGTLKSWLPNGRKQGKEFVVGSLSGEKGESLSINMNTGVWKDFSDGSGGSDLVSLYAALNGLTQHEAAKELSNDAPPRVRAWVPDTIKPTPIKTRSWQVPANWKQSHDCVHHAYGRPSNTWAYTNESGALIGYVARYDTPGGKKQFCPWTFIGHDWQAKKWPSYQPLYGMDILSARPHDPVLVVEGEKACDAARRICGDEYVCITWPGGANAYDGPDWSMVKGRNVLLWPDADKPGVEAMEKLRVIIGPIVANVATINVSIFREKWDAADALADGWTNDSFKKMLNDQFSSSVKVQSIPQIKIIEDVKPINEEPMPEGVLQIPGMLGRIVEWSLHTARKPQPIYSVAAALTLGSVLMGRRYVSSMNNWPSIYIIAIGKSATGKEHIKATIEGVLEASGLDALLGPSKYTSESGVISALVDKPTHIHITDELGMQLESANKDRSSAYRDISKIEMECFGRLHGTLHPVGYSTAGMTSSQKADLAARKVINPALTIMAMTTPITFYDAIGSKSLRDGFLNRFIVMECKAEREAGQMFKHVDPPEDVIQWCKSVRAPHSPMDGLIDVAHDAKPNPRTMEIEGDAMSAFRAFEDFALDKMNSLDKYGLAEMWGRANEIAMRLSMIVAVSCHCDRIKKEHAEWAIRFVRYFTNEAVVSSGINITESPFDSAVQDAMQRIKEAGSFGLSRKQIRESCRKFKALTYAAQNDVIKLLLEDGEFIAVERKKVRGPSAVAFVFSEFFDESEPEDKP